MPRHVIRSMLLSAAAIIGGACATLENRPAPQLSGTYSWEADAGSWNGAGTMHLNCDTAECQGTLATPFGESRITRTQFNGDVLHVVAETQIGTWSIWLTPSGHDLLGTFTYNRAEGAFEATRIVW